MTLGRNAVENFSLRKTAANTARFSLGGYHETERLGLSVSMRLAGNPPYDRLPFDAYADLARFRDDPFRSAVVLGIIA